MDLRGIVLAKTPRLMESCAGRGCGFRG
jgi:hypothetical protein